MKTKVLAETEHYAEILIESLDSGLTIYDLEQLLELGYECIGPCSQGYIVKKVIASEQA